MTESTAKAVIADWERADAFACWRLGVQMKRNSGLREGRYQPVNDDERKVVDEARR